MEPADKILLKKFLEGNCTDEAEHRRVQELLKQPNVQEVMEELTWAEWQQPAGVEEAGSPVFENWKKKLNDRISADGDAAEEEKSVIRFKPARFLRYAAVWAGIVLVSGLAVWQLKKAVSGNDLALVEKVNNHHFPVRYLLPDSSTVFLGEGARLSYTGNFDGDTREVNLKGEAFFEVVHNVRKPFIVHTGEIQTRVLGTSFKVEAVESRQIQVAVATGKVGVSAENKKQLHVLALLTPGHKVSWNRLTGKATQSMVDLASFEKWKNPDIVFEDRTMGNVADELQLRLGVKINFADKEAGTHRVSGTFSANEPAIKILKMLGTVGNFRCETKDNKSFNIYKLP